MKLTKEEKKALKEAKRLEKLRLEEEARKQLKRDELARELKAQELHRGALEKKLREMMIKVKEPIFRQDIQVRWQVFERVYDKKDFLISYLMKLINVADDQFQRTVASFCVVLDTMIDNFLKDLDDLSKENDLKTKKLLNRADETSSVIIRDHKAAEDHLQLMLFHAHTSADAEAWTTRGENLVKEDDDRSRLENDRENLRSFLENDYNVMWDQYKAVLKAYIVDTAQNQKKVRVLRRKENTMANIIASQGKKIANSGGLLKRLRTELIAYESGTKQAEFRDRRNRHRDACLRLKKLMTDGIETDVKQLARLVKVSDDTIAWLEAASTKVEKILRKAALSRKFETRREKVLPFGSDTPQSPLPLCQRKQQSDESFAANAMAATSGLARLWHRISKAKLAKRALLREKALLERENAFILAYLDSTQVVKDNMTPTCICTKQKVTSITENSQKVNTPIAIEGSAEASKLCLQATGSRIASKRMLNSF